MKRLKPLFLKTYGKERRKLSAWISPENRKQAFDSTRSTDSDSAPMFETAEPQRMRERKMSVCRRRAGRLAKSKAQLCLAEKSSDEECTPLICHQPAQQSKRTRVRKTRIVAADRPAKREAMSSLDISSNDENISRPSCPCPQQGMTTSGHLPSAGRFVTKRRRAAATKPKLSRATFTVLNSSDDFTSGASGSSRIRRPAKRRVPSTFVLSSAENSVNATRTASFATNPLQEISLSELTNHSLGPCPRKPIFCSTPSAGSLSKRLCLMPLSTHDHSTSPPSMSLSCVGVLNTFQEDVDSPGQPVTTPPAGLQPEEMQSSLGEHESSLQHYEEPSADLFMKPKSTERRNSCGEEAKSQSESIKIKNAGELPRLCLLSTGDSESCSHFVSAAEGLEWLIDALKEKCLTERCTVQLERLDNLTVSQLSSQTTTSSSCLGLSSSMNSRQTNEYPLSVDICPTTDHSRSSELSVKLQLSTPGIKTSDYFQSMNSFESSEHAALVTGRQSINKQGSMEQSRSVIFVDSTHHEDSNAEFIPGTQLPASSHVQTLFAVAVKDRCLSKKCTVPLKQMTLSQQMSDADKSENYHIHNIEVPADLTCSGEVTERMMASVGMSINSSSLVAQSSDLETEEKVSVLTKLLKEKCLTDKVIVELKRMTLSQLKEILQLSDTKRIKPKSPADVSGLACKDQTKHGHQSESDANYCDEETSTMKVGMKERGLTTSGDKSASHDEEVIKNACTITRNRRKTFQAPKEKKGRRSSSTDQPGTTRKACVSGLSVSRWKNKGSASSTHMFRTRTGGNKALDSSINELMSTQHKQPREWLGTTRYFSTPVKASRLNLSSLLADLTPNTHTWSRLKAALSVHRKNMVLLTPSSSRLSGSPGRTMLSDISQDLFATPYRKPLLKRLRSQQLSQDSPDLCEDAELSDAEKVWAECGQQCPLSWEQCILPQRMKQCVKIGEGTFGEVFSTINASGDTVALKIIPIEGSEKVNGEDQKTFGEILHEIIISKELSSLKEKQQNKTNGFIGLNDLHCVQGCYPPDFVKAWDAFDQRRGSENDRPDFFEKDQLFIILEFEFGGTDLENSTGKLTSLVVAKSILHQVTAALAVAEQELHFEHRDLHWGNVLVKTTKEKTGSFFLNGAAHSLETKGVVVRIIDYSLSRLEIDDLTVSCDISADEELFMGQGDYQFDIYRLMRQENGNNWSNYHPHTNVLWLHYLCSKLLSMKYRGARGRGAKGMREELTCFYDNVLQYSSATDVLQNCPVFQ